MSAITHIGTINVITKSIDEERRADLRFHIMKARHYMLTERDSETEANLLFHLNRVKELSV